MPGPAPKPDAQRRRRNATIDTTRLPAAGRSGAAPKWPLSKQRTGESVVWRDLWSTPQAVVWERLGWNRVVARYCRWTVAAYAADAPVSLLAELRQLEFQLGLTPMAMLRLKWQIVVEEPAIGRKKSADGVVVTPDRWRRTPV